MEIPNAARLLGGSEGGILSGVPPLYDTLNLFLVQAVVVLALCRVLGLVGSYFNQPKVIFEIIGGILLGPSAIGRNQAYMTTIFPKASLGYIGLVADIGLVLYLFIVGLELDPKLLMTHAPRAGGVAIMGIIVPFCLGVAISQTMFDNLQGDDPMYAKVRPEAFMVFIGTALSITAFPVLARILKENGLIYTVPGAMAMGAAALDDAVAWCLLILALSIGKSTNMSTAGYVFLSVIAFGCGLVFLVRPLFFRLVELVESWHSALWSNYLFALTLMLVFLSAWTTALLGVHAIFGSFLFGLICVPRDSHLFLECNECIEELVVTFMLPLYFALSGLKTDVTTINRAEDGAMVVLVCFVATIGKFVGAGSVCFFGGMSVRESSVVAVLMNTRGLVELIVLNLGMDAGILNVRTFSVMVIMCLFTTFITCPIIEIIYPPSIRNMMATQAAAKLPHDILSGVGAGDADPGNISASDGYADTEAGWPSGTPQEIVFNLEEMLMHAHLGIVVDRVEHLEGIMKITMMFAPLATKSSLDATALHFFEPSFTSRDVFVGLDAENKLLSVEEELTTVNLNTLERQRETSHKGTHSSQAEMLPLSMFVKAIGGRIEAFRIKGDPIHFPYELNSKAVQKDFNVILFPWRESTFVEQLFWGSIQQVSSPVALLIQNHISVLNVPDGQAGTRDMHSDGVSLSGSRSKSDSVPPRTLSDAADSADDSRGENRDRKDSGGASADNSPTFLSRSISVKASSNSALTNNDKIAQPENVVISKVLAVITGSPSDVLLLPFLLRCASNSNLSVTIIVCSNEESFPDALKESLASFKRRIFIGSLKNIAYEKIGISCNDPEALMLKISTGARYDLIVLGFAIISSTMSVSESASSPVVDLGGASTPLRKPSTESESDTTPPASAFGFATSSGVRRPSIPRSVARAVIEMVSPSPAVVDHRRQIGVPDRFVESTLEHPELGTLGTLLYVSKLSPFLLVYHEPKGGSSTFETRGARSGSVIATVPFDNMPTQSTSQELQFIREEITNENSSNDLVALGEKSDANVL